MSTDTDTRIGDPAEIEAAALIGTGPGVVLVEQEGAVSVQGFGGMTTMALPVFLRKVANILERQITG